MNILHINIDYFGSNPVHRTMMKEFVKNKKNGDSYHVFVPLDKKRKIVNADQFVTPVRCFTKLDKILYIRKQNRILNALKKSIELKQFDCIHAFTLFTDGNVAYRIHKETGIPYIVAVRDTDLNVFLKYKPYLRKRARKILANASAVLFLSKPYKEKLRKKLYPIGSDPIEKKTFIIPNGIDEYWLKNTAVPPKSIDSSKPLKLIFVGKINKRKNVTSAIDATNILSRSRQVKLTVIGNVEEQNIYEEITRNKCVEYCGSKSKEQLINYYRKHDIFVMPSHTETFGVVYAEAMTQGLPVVYTKGQGFDQQFDEGVVGYHVSDTNPNDIADAIIKIINDYERISKNCIANSKKFDWSAICAEYNKLYRRLAKSKQNTSGQN